MVRVRHAAFLLAPMVTIAVAAGPAVADAEAAKPRIVRLAAQPLIENGNKGIAAVGRVQGGRVVIRHLQRGCKRLKPRHHRGKGRRFAVAVHPRRKRCGRRGVRRGRARFAVCTGKRCVRRQIRIWRFRDSDGDRLGDLYERAVLRTSPRNPDTDGDGLSDGYEVLVLGSDPRDPNSPGPPPPPAPPAPPPDPPVTIAQPACADGAVDVTSSAAVRDEIDDGEDVCVVAAVGDVDLSDLGSSDSHLGSEGSGSMGSVNVKGTSSLTVRARLRSIELDDSDGLTIENSIIGGTSSNRVDDQLIFAPGRSDDVRIERNELGWTVADDSGNTGYGCRCYGELNSLRFVNNKLHDLAADGFQGVGGSDVLIDRNEIGPVGRNPGSSEHSDNIQITGNGENLRITNNWLHHQGYFDGSATANAGSTYIHGGDTSSLLYENNLIETAQGRTEICGLGTGGTSRSNITIRRNTWVDGGRAFSGFPGFEWDCDSGSGNTIARNVAIDPDGGFADNGYNAAIVAPNRFGTPSLVTLDAEGNCTSANCNPAGAPPIGYRKPSGVHW